MCSCIVRKRWMEELPWSMSIMVQGMCAWKEMAEVLSSLDPVLISDTIRELDQDLDSIGPTYLEALIVFQSNKSFKFPRLSRWSTLKPIAQPRSYTLFGHTDIW